VLERLSLKLDLVASADPDVTLAITRACDLDDLVADLPISWTDAGLPSSLAVSAAGTRDASRHLFLRAIAAGARVLRISSFPGHQDARNFAHRLSCLPRRWNRGCGGYHSGAAVA